MSPEEIAAKAIHDRQFAAYARGETVDAYQCGVAVVAALREAGHLPAPARPISFVRQGHDYGCGIACLAMATGQTYEAVHADLVAALPGRDFAEGGIHSHILKWYLAERGMVWRELTRYVPAEPGERCERMPWPPEPFAPRHIASVVQPSRNQHFVVVDPDGYVLDPLDTETGPHPLKRLEAWEDVNNVVGIWAAAGRLLPAAEPPSHAPNCEWVQSTHPLALRGQGCWMCAADCPIVLALQPPLAALSDGETH